MSFNISRSQDRSNRAGSSNQRPRAPTITIDTSNVQPPADEPQSGHASSARPISPTSNAHLSTSQPLDDSSSSFPSSESTYASQSSNSGPVSVPPADNRPTSPHNVSSFTQGLPSEFNRLEVPTTRSRGDSFNSSSDSVASSSLTIQEPEVDNGFITNDPDPLKPDPGQEQSFKAENQKFAFTAGQLNKMINPKSLPAFYALGGIQGLVKGVRSDLVSGLSLDEQTVDGQVGYEDATGSPKKSYELVALDQESQKEASEKDGEGKRKKKGKKKATKSPAFRPSAIPSDGHFRDRLQAFRDNRLPEKKTKNILQLAWIAYNDKILILLTFAAIISLAVGLYQTFDKAQHQRGEARIEWVEGVAIIVAIVIVVVVGAINDWQKERQFVKLNKKKEDRFVKVIRSGKSIELSVYDVLVGDVMHLEPGDLIPVDGVFISGHNVKCDEASATGESDLLRKTPAAEVYKAIRENRNTRKMDPFILSGSKVAEGVGTFLVTSVGVNSSFGKTMMALRDEVEATPLQVKLNTMAEYIAKLGGAAALLLFIVLFLEFCVKLKDNSDSPAQKGQQFLNILIVTITIVVVAVPEGLPLAVTLTLAFATTRMMKENNLVRLLRSCETMGNATTICSDKTGTLTQNVMTVVTGTIGTKADFDEGASNRVKSEEQQADQTDETVKVAPGNATHTCLSALHPEVRTLLEQSIVINSTAFEGDAEGKATFIGSKTETALLGFARDHLAMGSISEERSNANIVQLVPFDSSRKCMAAVVRLTDGRYRMYVKGASEILLASCTSIVRDPLQGLASIQMDRQSQQTLLRIITTYATRSLRTIGIIFRDFESWPPKNARLLPDDKTEVRFEDIFKHLTFLAVVGIQDPLRPGVAQAVKDCQTAGVTVRMVTGDNVLTAKAIAAECGIYNEKAGGKVMEGPAFRKLPRVEMDRIIPKLQVLARSSPEDKRILVKRLKELGETVAVTGDGTNDAPALKMADVGFSMGITGTEVAKEASAIILMDDNFSSIVKALMWGRAVNDAVKKFLQFQITVNITAVLLTFISAVASGTESSVLTAVQLLWVNLIMDTFAALALATDPPQPSIINRRPDPKSAPLITLNMWKMIIGQAVYQLAITLVLNFRAVDIFGFTMVDGNLTDTLNADAIQVPTLVFNTFVWMQIFNQYNCRRLDNHFNIFEGVLQNPFFIIINIIMVGGQVLIIFKGGAAFGVQQLGSVEWGISIILGALSIGWGMVLRLIPDELIRSLIPNYLRSRIHHRHRSDEELNSRYQWNPAMVEIREELSFLRSIRGGRLNQIKFSLRHPREMLTRSRSNSVPGTPTRHNSTSESPTPVPMPPTPVSHKSRRRGRSRTNSSFGPAAAMMGIVAGSIGGFSPIEKPPGDGFGSLAAADGGHGNGKQASGLARELEGNPQMTVTRPSDGTDEAATATTRTEPAPAPPPQSRSSSRRAGVFSTIHEPPEEHEGEAKEAEHGQPEAETRAGGKV